MTRRFEQWATGFGLVLMCISSAGCAADFRGVRLALYSEPPGALLYQDHDYLGTAPLNLYYRVDGAETADSIDVGPYHARFPDGTVVELSALRIDVPAGYGICDSSSPYADLIYSFSDTVHAYKYTFTPTGDAAEPYANTDPPLAVPMRE